MAIDNETLNAIKEVMRNCVSQYTMPRQLTEEKLDRIVEAVENTNTQLEKLNGTVAEDHDIVVALLQWRDDHEEKVKDINKRIDANTREGRVVGVVQALWAPVAAYLYTLFRGGNP